MFVVPTAEWQAAHDALLVKEAATRAGDALAADWRRLPMQRIDKPYAFEGPDGIKTFAVLFDCRRQLLLYHFMFVPGVDGWPHAGCPGCSTLGSSQKSMVAPFCKTDFRCCTWLA